MIDSSLPLIDLPAPIQNRGALESLNSSSVLDAKLTRWLPPTHPATLAGLTIYSAASLHAEFPTVSVGIVKPESHVR
jgi:hypothetical protein